MSDPTDAFLALVPARVGSTALPQKDLRMLRGRPLVAHTVAAIEGAGIADRLIVSTDDQALRNWAQLQGHLVHERDPQLADNISSLGELAARAADEFAATGTVGVFPPSSPFCTQETIREALREFHVSAATSLTSCVRVERLHWHAPGGDPQAAVELTGPLDTPLGSEGGVFQENGAIYLVDAATLREQRKLITDAHMLFEMSAEESLRIDRITDLVEARRRMTRGSVVFRVRADRVIGSGHLFHCLQLADELADQDIAFLLKDCEPWVQDMIQRYNYPVRPESNLVEDLLRLAPDGARVLVNDKLDTDETEVLSARAAGFKVVNIEDLGSGARFADWVVNALYRPQVEPANLAWGARYATLREEFFNVPAKVIREAATEILISFGGTDPANLALRCARLLSGLPNVALHVIQGPGAPDQEFPDNVRVSRSVPSMAQAMLDADLMLTSAGRTVYEAARVGTPVVVLAANAREATHAHIGYESGVVFLGIGPLVTDEHILDITTRTLADAALRRELSTRLRDSIDDGGTWRIGVGIRNLLGEP